MVLLTALLAEIPSPVHATGSNEVTNVTRKKSRVDVENETNVQENKFSSCYKRNAMPCCEGRNTKCKGVHETIPISTKACYCDDSCTLLKGKFYNFYEISSLFQVIH